LPLHCTEPGEHWTHVLLKQTGVAPVQLLADCQLPFASHD
jgi:hypothetical protein